MLPVAEFFARRDFAVRSRSRIAGVRLVADDAPFSAGTGLDVSGPLLALVMTMAGRETYLDQLTGPGLSTFRGHVPS